MIICMVSPPQTHAQHKEARPYNVGAYHTHDNMHTHTHIILLPGTIMEYIYVKTLSTPQILFSILIFITLTLVDGTRINCSK